MSLGSELSFFKEKQEVTSLICTVCSSAWENTFECDFGMLDKVLIQYQEQPQLLGPYIGELLEPLVDCILQFSSLFDRSAYFNERGIGLVTGLAVSFTLSFCSLLSLFVFLIE